MLHGHQDTGKYIASYRLIREIATTSASRTFLAQKDDTFHQPVVIKFLFPIVLFSELDKESFLQKARFLKQLQHRFISSVVEFGVDKFTPYIITKYAPLGSLHDFMQRQSSQPLPLTEALRILSQIGQALEYAHKHNIIHCNIKPQNILFNAKGDALLADFSFTTLSMIRRSSSLITSKTMAYLAPEQLAGTISKECDQYALGCIAYELFTGHPPFSTSYLSRLELQHKEEIPLTPTSLNPFLPLSLEQAILQALAKEPTQRHSDISAFLRALQISTRERAYTPKQYHLLQPSIPIVVEATHNPLHLSAASSLRARPASEVKTSILQAVQVSVLPSPEVAATPPHHQPTTALVVLPTTQPISRLIDKLPLQKPSISLGSLSAQASRLWTNLLAQGKGILSTARKSEIVLFDSLQRKKRQTIAFAPLAIVVMMIGLLLVTSLLQIQSGIDRTQSLSTAPTSPHLSMYKGPEPTQVRTTPTPTPLSITMAVAPPIPTPIPSPTYLPPSGLLMISPVQFSPGNCPRRNFYYKCTATLAIGANAQGATFWSANSTGIMAAFRPPTGTISPGQSLQITINVYTMCAMGQFQSGTLNFTVPASASTISASWNC